MPKKKYVLLQCLMFFCLLFLKPVKAIDCQIASTQDERVICKTAIVKNYDSAESQTTAYFKNNLLAANENFDSYKEVNPKETSTFLTKHSDLQLIFLFPVIEDKIKLKVTIPKDFKPLQSDPNSELLEFIPKSDKDPYRWSQIVTLTKILGTGITAKEYITELKDLFIKSTDKNAKVIDEKKQDDPAGYQVASTIIKYHTNTRDEVVILYSVSGPFDIANVQYALPLLSEDKLNEVVQKLRDFIENNVEIVNK